MPISGRSNYLCGNRTCKTGGKPTVVATIRGRYPFRRIRATPHGHMTVQEDGMLHIECLTCGKVNHFQFRVVVEELSEVSDLEPALFD